MPFTLDSPVLGRAWVNQIYLPHGYSDGAIYPVIYLLHGTNSDSAGWVRQADIVTLVDRLIRSGRMRKCIIVMPSAGNSWYLDGPERMETALPWKHLNKLRPRPDVRRSHATPRPQRPPAHPHRPGAGGWIPARPTGNRHVVNPGLSQQAWPPYSSSIDRQVWRMLANNIVAARDSLVARGSRA